MPPEIMNLDEMIQKLQNEIRATAIDIENTRLNLIYLQDKLDNFVTKKNVLVKFREEMQNCISILGKDAVYMILQSFLNQQLKSELIATQQKITED